MDATWFKTLTDYGVLGLAVLGLGFLTWFLIKRELSRAQQLIDDNKQLADANQKLVSKLTEHMEQDHQMMVETITNSTTAVQELTSMIDTFLQNSNNNNRRSNNNNNKNTGK